MISIPLIDELRATRRQLAEQCGCDVDQYAAMLQQVSQRHPGQYIQKPLDSDAGRIATPVVDRELISTR